MLAPQFSLRRLLAWVTASGFLCLIAAAAARGKLWAAGIVIAIIGMAVLLAVHAAMYGVVRAIVRLRDRPRAAAAPLGAGASAATRSP
jgi:hypothetical protein